MNHEAHDDVFATKDTKVTKRRKPFVERLLVTLVFSAVEPWTVQVSVISVAADVSL